MPRKPFKLTALGTEIFNHPFKFDNNRAAKSTCVARSRNQTTPSRAPVIKSEELSWRKIMIYSQLIDVKYSVFNRLPLSCDLLCLRYSVSSHNHSEMI
jgi:hypothetical protein